MIKLRTIFICLIPFTSFAQNFDLGSWNVLHLKLNYPTKWSVFAEAQIRSLKFYDNFHYYEYKGGLNYKSNEQLTLTIGTGSYQTFKEGGNFVLPKNNNEFRIWPQILVHQSIGRIKIEQRYRSELRFTSNGYRNRFRYRVGLSYSFGEKINGYNPFQLNTSNELFFTDNEPYFERNRWLVAFNYKPNKNTTLQIGYIHQFDYKINDETGRDFLQVGYFFDLFNKQITNQRIDTDLKDN